MDVIAWLAAVALVLILLTRTYRQAFVWFANGAVWAMIASVFGASLSAQFWVFLTITASSWMIAGPFLKERE